MILAIVEAQARLPGWCSLPFTKMTAYRHDGTSSARGASAAKNASRHMLAAKSPSVLAPSDGTLLREPR